MSTIITLPKNLANQIAAGEVVERPISVVKELVENSLDAGATSITVEIRNGGIDEIVVSDNGKGVDEEDLHIIGTKHATSKIRSLEDLYTVLTFGFRGEAIASISSVSDFEIISRTSKSIGGKSLKIIGGERQKICDVATDIGTKVIIKNLFAHTPARLNYLKSSNTERAHIEDFLQQISLAYSNVSFTFFSEGKKIFSYPQEEASSNRIYSVFGETFYENILPVHFSFAGITITGAITHPKIHFQNKEKQVLFVNKRLIKSPTLYKAIFDGYNRFIPHGTFAGYVLNIELDPTQVDVNVHPRKQEIRFAKEQDIFRAAYNAIEKTLDSASLIGKDAVPSPGFNTPQEGASVQEKQYYVGSGTKFKSYSPYKDTSSHPNQSQIPHAMGFTQAILGATREIGEIGDVHQTSLGKIIGQIFHSYIVVESGKKLVIFDQHALAERVIFEKLCHKKHETFSQTLLISSTLHLSAKEASIYEEHTEVFSDMGFQCEMISGNSLLVSAIPDFVKKENIEDVLLGVLGDIGEFSFTQKSKTLDEIQNKVRAYTACRSAIKFGDGLTIFEMHRLLEDATLDYSATCPHGRPVAFEIDRDDLKGKYDR